MVYSGDKIRQLAEKQAVKNFAVGVILFVVPALQAILVTAH